MAFTPKDWKDFPLTETPLSAAALEDLEERLAALTGKAKDWGVVEALPGEAATGDYCTFKAAAGVYWRLIYTGEATYPWAKIGGPPLFHEVESTQNTTSKTYVNLGTEGPKITTPLKGDYDVAIGCSIFNVSASQEVLMSYAIGGTGAADADASHAWTAASQMGWPGSRTKRKTALAASTALVAKYRTTAGGEVYFINRWMTVDPTRVG